MGYVIRMPQLGMSMEQGLIVEWTVDEGDEVVDGDVIAIVESEKTQAEVEAREDGVLGRILIEANMVVEPGDPIGILVGPGEAVTEYEDGLDVPEPLPAAALGDTDTGTGEDASRGSGTAADSPDGDGGGEPAAEVKATPGARQLAEDEGIDLTQVDGTGPQGVITDEDVNRVADAGTDEAARATPGARQRAEELGLDLTGIDGSGPQGVITEDDVEAAIEAGASAGGGATRTVTEARPLSGMQRTIADRLSESYGEAVHVTLNRSFDTSALTATVTAAREAGVTVSITDLLVKAVGAALSAHPAFNAVFEDEEHRLIEEVNVGVAVDIDRGLVTPVIGTVTEKTADEVNTVRRNLTDRVQSGAFTMDDLEGGTFTISNLGMFGVDHFDPIINPPQVAILGVGRTRDDGEMTLSLSFDHRVVNGADAARFLDTVVETATSPQVLEEYFDADVAVAGGRDAETREIHVESTGFSGSYEVAGLGGQTPFDEPLDMGGSGLAPTPVEHLLGALGACLSLAVRSMADRDDIAVGTVACDVDGTPDHGPVESADVTVRIESDADADAVDRAVTKAVRACYVERAIGDEVTVSVDWERA